MKVLIWKARCRILTQPQSLKEKRSVVKSALAKVRNKFSLSCAEVGSQEVLNLVEFGFSSVDVKASTLEALVEKCRHLLERDYPLEIFEEDLEIEAF